MTGYKRPPLTPAVPFRQPQQNEYTDEISGFLTGATVEGLTVELRVSGDNLLHLRLSRTAGPHGDARKMINLTLAFNELGMWVHK